MMALLMNLLVGLPGQRPGGLTLSLAVAIAAAAGAILLGFGYAVIATQLPRASVPVQAAMAVLRGVPVLLLVFMLSLTSLSLRLAAVSGMVLYSLAHVGEILRAFLALYPVHMVEQANLLGLTPGREWVALRIPWTFWHSLPTLGTHWVSLLKDTGALVILGMPELTTVTKMIAEGPVGQERWVEVLLLGTGLYLAAALALVWGLRSLMRRGAGRAIPVH